MPNVVIFTYKEENSDLFEIAERIYITLPGCGVVLLCEKLEIAIIEKAMQAGIRKVISLNSDEKTLVENIKLVYNTEAQRASKKHKAVTGWQSKVITVFGTKGGIGKTTISANLATSLARLGKKVIIVDLDLQFGDLNMFFDIEPKDTIAELVNDRTSFDIDTIKSFSILHYSSVSVLSSPKSPELAEYVTANHIEQIINTIRPYYDYIIVDTTPVFNDISITALEQANNIFFVTVLDIPTLRNSKLGLDILESLQIKDKVNIIINRLTDGLITVKDGQKILGIPISYTISNDYAGSLNSLNKGVPIVLNMPRSEVSRDIEKMASSISK